MRPQPHWLVRRHTVRRLWLGFLTLLALTLLGGVASHPHVVFGFEDLPGFYALFGFAVCVAMVVLAKVLGIFLKRRESYYDRPDTSPGAEGGAEEEAP